MMPFPWLSTCPLHCLPTLCLLQGSLFRCGWRGARVWLATFIEGLSQSPSPEPLPRWGSVLQSPVGCHGRDVTDRDSREKVSAQRVWERSWVLEGLETARAKAEPSGLCRETRPRGPPLFLRGTSTPAPPRLLPRRGCRTGREKGRAWI